MADSQLVTILKTLNYDNETIRAMTAAAEGVEIAKVEARAAGLTELKTPLQCAAQGGRTAQRLKHLAGRLYSASLGSGAGYRLPMNGQHCDPYEIDRHIAHCSVSTRMELKSALRELRLIPA
jgi:hypothetical protein